MSSAQEQVRLAEYGRLRDEVGRRTTIQQALIALNLTVAGAITHSVAAEHSSKTLFLAVVFLSVTFGVLWLDHHVVVHRIAGYIQKELWIWRPCWELHLRDHQDPSWWSYFFRFAIIVAFVGVAGAALWAANPDVSGFLRALWWIGAVMTAILFICFVVLFKKTTEEAH